MDRSKTLTKSELETGKTGDWHGNNVAIVCPVCGKIFIISAFTDKDGRICPICNKSKVTIDTARAEVKVEW